MMRQTLIALLFITAPARAFEPLSIQDNSFLIEEAYNQEPGVYQQIFTFLRDDDDEAVGSFTQEIPVGGQQHQLSYTLSMLDLESASGIGDALINYRYQLVGDGTTRLAISPRVSLLIPSGDEDRGLGADDWGYELNLPVSYAFSDRLVTHWNTGVTSADETDFFAGGSIISAVREKFHLMLETRWSEESQLVVSPGLRWAWDLSNGFQIVPGVAVPIGEDTKSVFLYLSLER
jgi:hypothetical protein